MVLFSYLQLLIYFIYCTGAFFLLLFKQVPAIFELWTFPSSMPFRGRGLMSVSTRLRPGGLRMFWMVPVSASCQDNSYFFTDRVWMHIDWWEFSVFNCFTVAIIATVLNAMFVLHILSVCVFIKIWLCQNLVKHNSHFVKLLVGAQKQTCMFQIKRILGFCCRYRTESKGNSNLVRRCYKTFK